MEAFLVQPKHPKNCQNSCFLGCFGCSSGCFSAGLPWPIRHPFRLFFGCFPCRAFERLQSMGVPLFLLLGGHGWHPMCLLNTTCAIYNHSMDVPLSRCFVVSGSCSPIYPPFHDVPPWRCLEDRNLLNLRSLDSLFPFFLSDNGIWGRWTQMLRMLLSRG